MLYVIGLELCELCFLTESMYVYELIVEINERLSLKNSFNVLCYRLNCMNCFFSRIGVCISGNWT